MRTGLLGLCFLIGLAQGYTEGAGRWVLLDAGLEVIQVDHQLWCRFNPFWGIAATRVTLRSETLNPIQA